MVKVKQYNPQSFLGKIAESLGVCISQWGDRVAVTLMHDLDYSRVALTETHCHVVLWGSIAKNHKPCAVVIREDDWQSIYQLTCKLLQVKAEPYSEIFLAALQTAPDAIFEKYLNDVVKSLDYDTIIDASEALRRLIGI